MEKGEEEAEEEYGREGDASEIKRNHCIFLLEILPSRYLYEVSPVVQVVNAVGQNTH